MRDRIWYEMTQSLFNENYISKLILRQRRAITIINIIIIIFSTSGIMGWAIWTYYPIIACAIVSAVSIFKLILPSLFGDQKFLQKMDEIQDFYQDYSNKLERLWYDLEDNTITIYESKDLFFNIKKTENTINSKTNEVLEKQFFLKKIEKESSEETIIYIKNIFKV